jgi:hypothetical protein
MEKMNYGTKLGTENLEKRRSTGQQWEIMGNKHIKWKSIYANVNSGKQTKAQDEAHKITAQTSK